MEAAGDYPADVNMGLTEILLILLGILAFVGSFIIPEKLKADDSSNVKIQEEKIKELIENKVGSYVDSMLNERMLSVLSTKENVNLQTLGFSATVESEYQAIVTPIDIAGERLGTLFIYKQNETYGIDGLFSSSKKESASSSKFGTSASDAV